MCLASLDGVIVRNSQTLAQIREWFRESGKATIHAVRITSALKPDGSRDLQPGSWCPLVLNVGSEIVEPKVKYRVGVKGLYEIALTLSLERSVSELAHPMEGKVPNTNVCEAQVSYAIIAMIHACSEEMAAGAVGNVIDDLKLTRRASMREPGRGADWRKAPWTAAIRTAILNSDLDWKCLEGGGQVGNETRIVVVSDRPDEVVHEARRNQQCVVHLPFIIRLTAKGVEKRADVAGVDRQVAPISLEAEKHSLIRAQVVVHAAGEEPFRSRLGGVGLPG